MIICHRLLAKIALAMMIFMMTLSSALAADRVVDLGKDSLTDGAFDIFKDVNAPLDVILSSDTDWISGPMPAALGPIPGGAWMRFRATNSDPDQSQFTLMLTEANLPFVDFYVTDIDGNLVSLQMFAGFDDYHDRNIVYRLPVFDVTLPHGEERIIYARLANTFGGMFAQFKIFTPNAFMIFQFHESMLFGGFYVMLVLFAVMSLLCFAAIKQKVFVSYAILGVATILSSMTSSGYWVHFLPVQSTGFVFFIVSTSLYTSCVCIFTRHFFALHDAPGWMSKLLLVQAIIGGIFALLPWFAPVSLVGNLVMIPLVFLLMIPLMSWGLVLVSRKKLVLFSIAWTIYMSGVVAQFVLGQIGLISNVVVTMYIGTIAAAIEMMLLALNMGLRVADLRQQADRLRREHVAHLESFSDRLATEVKEKTRQLAEARDAAILEAQTDSLTRLKNRRAFTLEGKALLDQHAGRRGIVCAIMMDVDHFKGVNDSFGHDVGDMVLIEIADALTDIVRKGDIAARLGGEEFAVLAHFDGLEDAAHLAERIRKDIEHKNIAIGDGREVKVTVSLGIYSDRGKETLDCLLTRADKALYEAKRNGRNQVKVYKAA